MPEGSAEPVHKPGTVSQVRTFHQPLQGNIRKNEIRILTAFKTTVGLSNAWILCCWISVAFLRIYPCSFPV